MTYEVISGPKERFIGNITANIDFFVNGEKVRTLGVAGRIEVHRMVYLAARPLKQNEIITAGRPGTEEGKYNGCGRSLRNDAGPG